MSIPVTITSALTHETVEVRDGALLTTSKATAPTQVEAQSVKVYTTLMVDANGAANMGIDGSSAPVEYTISPVAGVVLGIESLRFVYHSNNMNIESNESRRFGPISAPGLTNGLTIRAHQAGVVTDIFLNPVKVIADFYRYAGGPTVGINTAIVNDKDAVSAGVDFLMVLVALPATVSLYPGTYDKISLIIQDDLSGIVLSEVQGYGTQVPA